MGSKQVSFVERFSLSQRVPYRRSHCILLTAAAVEARVAVAQSDTSASVYWNSLTIPDTDIDNYTIVYSPVTSNNPQEATVEMRAVFPGSYTSANITGLIPGLGYQFQVFATVTLAGEVLEGERSVPLLVNMSEWPWLAAYYVEELNFQPYLQTFSQQHKGIPALDKFANIVGSYHAFSCS